jgi:hypothetical protein
VNYDSARSSENEMKQKEANNNNNNGKMYDNSLGMEIYNLVSPEKRINFSSSHTGESAFDISTHGNNCDDERQQRQQRQQRRRLWDGIAHKSEQGRLIRLIGA